MRKFLLPAAIALTLAAGSTAASAERVDVRVKYPDLDLSKQADLDKLKGRIVLAATQACSARDIFDFVPESAKRRCVKDATAKALASLESRHNVTLAAAM